MFFVSDGFLHTLMFESFSLLVIGAVLILIGSSISSSDSSSERTKLQAEFEEINKTLQKNVHLEGLASSDFEYLPSEIKTVKERSFKIGEFTQPQYSIARYQNIISSYVRIASFNWGLVLRSGEVIVFPAEKIEPVFCYGIPSARKIQIGRSLKQHLLETMQEKQVQPADIEKIVKINHLRKYCKKTKEVSTDVGLTYIKGFEPQVVRVVGDMLLKDKTAILLYQTKT